MLYLQEGRTVSKDRWILKGRMLEEVFWGWLLVKGNLYRQRNGFCRRKCMLSKGGGRCHNSLLVLSCFGSEPARRIFRQHRRTDFKVSEVHAYVFYPQNVSHIWYMCCTYVSTILMYCENLSPTSWLRCGDGFCSGFIYWAECWRAA